MINNQTEKLERLGELKRKYGNEQTMEFSKKRSKSKRKPSYKKWFKRSPKSQLAS